MRWMTRRELHRIIDEQQELIDLQRKRLRELDERLSTLEWDMAWGEN